MTRGFKCDKCRMFYEGDVFFVGGVTKEQIGKRDTIKSTAAYHIELCQTCAAERFDDLIQSPVETNRK